MNEEEPWVNLSGCNTCINPLLCAHLGNCALLNIDMMYPENNKRKRNYIQKLKYGVERPDLYAQEMKL